MTIRSKCLANAGDLLVRGRTGWKTLTPADMLAGLIEGKTTPTPFKIRANDYYVATTAEADDNLDAAENLGAALPTVFSLLLQPDIPRTILWEFIAHAQITAYTIVIVGIDAQGSTVTETLTAASGWKGETAHAFVRITSITMTHRTGTGAADTMKLGLGSKIGLSNPIGATSDVYKVTLLGVDDLPANYTVIVANALIDVTTGGGSPVNIADAFGIQYNVPLNLAV
jgi:hypothetical protein